MPISYTKLRPSFFSKNKMRKDTAATLHASQNKWTFTVKRIFVKRNPVTIEENGTVNSPLLAKNEPLAVMNQAATSTAVDVEAIKAFQSVFEALHDLSILDAKRHLRYNLYAPIIIPETPPYVTQHHEVIYVPTPRSGRNAIQEVNSTTREISTKHPHAIQSVQASVPTPTTQGVASAVIEASRHLDLDIVEIMRIHRPPSVRTGREKSGSLLRQIATERLLNVEPLSICPSSPHPKISSYLTDVRMASNGTDLNHAPSKQELAPPAYNCPRVMNTADMRILRFLGEGTTGKVYFAKDTVSNVKVALKVVEKKDKNEYTLSIIVQELNILQKLDDSPWFVKLYCSWHDHDNMYIAMTVYPTDLDSELIRSVKLESERARFYMAELIIAITELHKRGIIHRDVKAPNILIDREGHVVLADFGLSKDFHHAPSIAERVYQPYWPYLPDENPTSDTEPRDPEDLYFVAWDYRGSELEMAPEIHLRQAYSFGVDFWSAAVVLYWMLTGRPPWYEQEDLNDPDVEVDDKPLALKIAEDELYFDPLDEVDEVTQDFLQKMLVKNPKKRLMIDYEMPNHPYFAGVNWPLLEARAIPAPWVPEYEICHVYEQTSPTFSPGTPYSEDDEDPYPTFTHMSKQSKRRIVYEEYDDMDSESDYGILCGVEPAAKEVQDNEPCPFSTLVNSCDKDEFLGRRENHSNMDGTLLNTPVVTEWKASEYQDGSTLPVDALNESSTKEVSVITESSPTSQGKYVLPVASIQKQQLVKENWDVTIISPPRTTPYSPGPKGWLQAQDLITLCSRTPATFASSGSSTSSVEVMYVALQSSTVGAATQDDQFSNFTHLAQCNNVESTSYPQPRQANHVVNGTGLLFKAKVWWMSKTWTPKPKKSLGLKRLSC